MNREEYLINEFINKGVSYIANMDKRMEIIPVGREHREFIPKIKGWLESYTEDSVWVVGNEIRDREFYRELILLIELRGWYRDGDREWLRGITKEYYKSYTYGSK